jgi:hypothetical protein
VSSSSAAAVLGPSETRYEAEQFAVADVRAMQVVLMHATKELCGADALTAGREAAGWSRRASARIVLAQEAGHRTSLANESSWFNEWHAARLGAYLERRRPTAEVRAVRPGAHRARLRARRTR